MTTLARLSERAGPWLRSEGPDSGVVISSRVRLARNLAGYPFPTSASEQQAAELLETAQQRVFDAGLADRLLWIDLGEATELDRQLLTERHLISHLHSQVGCPRGVALADDESLAVTVNEEDHLRLQALRGGMQIEDAYRQVNEADDALERRLDFAYSSTLGYLTVCPTNVGTGIRVSVMLHLPGLKLTGEIEKLRRAARDMHLAVRGFHGEGSESVGDLYQVSNQTTLGRSEQQILSDFQDQIIPQMIEYEQRARQALADGRPTVIDDRIHRAWGALSHARLLGNEETLYLLSSLRLGVCMGRIEGVGLPALNEMLLLSQPAHLQKIAGEELDDARQRQFRATFVRQRLGV